MYAKKQMSATTSMMIIIGKRARIALFLRVCQLNDDALHILTKKKNITSLHEKSNYLYNEYVYIITNQTLIRLHSATIPF